MYTILMVDDEENIRKSLINETNWEELGFKIVAEASNGIEALDYIENNDIDLMVSDIKMPIMGGIELAKAAREIRPSMQIVFLTGYDYFDFAKQAIKYNIIEYILKPLDPEKIKAEFTNIKEKLDERFFEILDIDKHSDAVKELERVKRDVLCLKLIDNSANRYQIEKMFSQTQLNIPIETKEGEAFAVCVVKCEESTDAEENDVKLMRLYNITKIISRKYLNSVCTTYEDCVVSILYGSKAKLDKYINILAKDIILSAKRVMKMKLYFGQSNYYEDIMKTSIAFSQANEAVISIEKTDNQIVQISDIVPQTKTINIQQIILTLENGIISGNKDDAEKYIKKIFSKLNREGVSELEYNTCILEIIAMIFRTERMIGEEVAIKNDFFDIIKFHQSRGTIERQIKELSYCVIDGIKKQRKTNVDILARAAKEIIEKEYYNPELSLSTIADRLHCSPNYLSSGIKKNLGKSFVELLTDTRMKKAKDLLVFSNKKIREVSNECGYANQHYFSYSFKKYYNVSPNSMRNTDETPEDDTNSD